jgi:hypothetical protein
MSVTLVDMATWEQTAYDADKPMMVATNNSDKITKASSGWFDAYNGATDDTDETVVSNARVRAYDRIGALTVASDTARTSPAFRLAFGSDVTFDTVVIMGHNFGDVTNSGSDITVDLIATGAATTSTISDAITVASGDNSRLVFTFLYNTSGAKPSYPQRVTLGTSNRKLNIRLQNVSGSTSTKPAIGEIWVGQRRQLMHNPNLPFDDKSETGLVSDFASKSGLTQRYTYHRGKALRTINKSVTDSNELAAIEAAFDDSDDFTKPIVWIENPSQSSPDAYLMLAESPTLSLPLQGPIERVFGTSLIEQPPFKSSGT